jgi:glyoxylate/hydroxypyruvate reductase A
VKDKERMEEIMNKHHLLIIHRWAPDFKDYLQKLIPDLKITAWTSAETMPPHIAEIDIILGWKFPQELPKKAKKLKWIQSIGAGVDHIIGQPELSKDVIITRTIGDLDVLMAEYVLGFCLYFTLQVPRLLENKNQAKWEPFPTNKLEGKALALLGLGAIGSTIALKAKGLGMHVLGAKKTEGSTKGVDQLFIGDQWTNMLPQADFFVIALPITPETEGLVKADALKLLKKDCYLINISRGKIVDEHFMIKMLKDKKLAGAALDVFDEEPLPADNPLWKMPHVVISPHIAGVSQPEGICPEFYENYQRFIKGKPLHYAVNRAQGY